MVAAQPASDSVPVAVEWLTLPEVADVLGVRQRDVRAAIADHRLPACREGGRGPLRVPADFLEVEPDDGRWGILPSLRGTATVLADAGLDTEASVAWLLAPESTLGASPVAALRAGRVREVRRAAQVLAL